MIDKDELLEMGFVEEGLVLVLPIDRRLHNLDTREWQLIYHPRGEHFELYIIGVGSAGRLYFQSDNDLDMFYYSITGKHLVKLSISQKIGYGFMHRTIENII